MKHTYKLEDLCCASCSNKIEKALNQLEGIQDVHVNLMAQKLSFESELDDLDPVILQIKKIIKKYEPDCTLLI
jgi:copper chaperone CopZ